MPPPEQPQQPGQPAVGMPQVNPNLLAGDDYVYEVKPRQDKPVDASQAATGGMATKFEITSSALDRNI
jgi:hypothetical protein